MFLCMLLELAVPRNYSVSFIDNIYLHAVILSRISCLDPDLGKDLHDYKRFKPVTMAIISADGRRTLVRISFIAENCLQYAKMLVSSITDNPQVLLGRTQCEVQAVDLSSSPYTGAATWQDLMNDYSHSKVRFEFLSPTAIRRENYAGISYTGLEFPVTDIFLELFAKWNHFTGPLLPISPDRLRFLLERGACITSAYSMCTEKHIVKERIQLGVRGFISYKYLCSEPEFVMTLNALSQFAFFSGIGYQTARGMGSVYTQFQH